MSIIDAGEQLMTTDFCDAFVVDVLQGGDGIAINVNQVISRLSGVPWQLVNASQSTADVCATAMRISLWEMSQDTSRRLQQVESSLRSKAGQFQHIRTIGRTCLRDASQTSLGETFRAFADLIRRREDRLRSALRWMLEVNLEGEKASMRRCKCSNGVCDISMSIAFRASQRINPGVKAWQRTPRRASHSTSSALGHNGSRPDRIDTPIPVYTFVNHTNHAGLPHGRIDYRHPRNSRP